MSERLRGWSMLFVLAPLALAGPAFAQAFRADTFEMCANAAAQVEVEEGIPAGLLGAIALVETGRGNPFNNGRRSAWPWTVNIEGKGAHLDSKAEALRIVEGKLLDGVGLIDVGCFGINLYHHPAAFQDLAQAFDPLTNARYSARFLKAHYAATQSWDMAVGRYHNMEATKGNAYRSRVQAAWLGQGTSPPQSAAARRPPATREGEPKPDEQANLAALHEAWDPGLPALEQAADLFEAQDWSGALAIYDKVLAFSPDRRIALLGRAMCLDRMGHHAKAGAAYQRALLADPFNPTATRGLIAMVDRLPREKAMERLESAREVVEGSAVVVARLALLKADAGQAGPAADLMIEAARQAPDEPSHALNAALLLDRAGRRAEAVAAYEFFLRHHIQSAEAVSVSVDTIRRRLDWLRTTGS
ncbi:MAG: hypothetical protein HQL41_11765 [Alphaproteobacteria bacterium]|nr:hypothetical protein [Alphaproteobacteria bacterium]